MELENNNVICCFFGAIIIAISISMQMQKNKRHIHLQKLKLLVVNIPANVGNFLTNEVEKTKEYQKKSWEEMKTQTRRKLVTIEIVIWS